MKKPEDRTEFEVLDEYRLTLLFLGIACLNAFVVSLYVYLDWGNSGLLLVGILMMGAALFLIAFQLNRNL